MLWNRIISSVFFVLGLCIILRSVMRLVSNKRQKKFKDKQQDLKK